ncbi:MAG TPA: MBL fold metallo-hydrolase, partial [Kofleriaceae bacterium]|nr:MBL fold metallo-hydrolase [Kofleriaceae bacterium]
SRVAALATRPARGPLALLRWKLGRRRDPRAAAWRELDRARPAVRPGGAEALAAGAPVACWIGHATWALRLGGAHVVIDPIFGRIAGLLPRLTPPGVAADALPPVDVVLVTHDHRDHMDLRSLRRLGGKPTFVTGLGNGRRLRGLGDVVELDWWQRHRVGDLDIQMVPARHWSMRAPWNRNQALWGGFVVRAPEGVAYHAGDTAWGDHFAEIGARVGPIDWAMLPIGGYAPRWFMEPQHVDPDEAARGFEALGARNLLAMHWGTFRLTDEPVGEPPARLRAWWRARGLPADRLWILDAGESRPLG